MSFSHIRVVVTATIRNAVCFSRLAEGDNNVDAHYNIDAYNNVDAYNNMLLCACTRLSPEYVNVNVCMKYG